MRRKTIEELTIVDDFMFGAVMRNPERCKPLLEMILGKKIARIEIPVVQKAIIENYESKSIRLDLYIQDDVGTVYNVEIQTTDKGDLPWRSRYYHGLIDLDVLEKGGNYADLENSIVIFICTFDPFDLGRYIYTFENRCNEEDSFFLGDGTKTIFLNTVVTRGIISDELRTLFDYMNGNAPKDRYTELIDKDVRNVKADEKWRISYMRLSEKVNEGFRTGRYVSKIEIVRANRDSMSHNDLARFSLISPVVLQRILDTIDAHPEWDDEEVAENVNFRESVMRRTIR